MGAVQLRIRALALILCAGSLFAVMHGAGSPVAETDERAVAELDRQYQEAVKENDAATMERILADDFVLITGKGRTQVKADLLKEAKGTTTVYEHQEDSRQIVRVWGDTAVVTALLWAKGTQSGKSFEYRLWFSDVYVRTPAGWRYVLGQAAQPLEQPN